MENILTLLSVLLATESILIIGVMVYFMRTPRQRRTGNLYDDALIRMQAAFDEKTRELAAKYAEEMEALKFFEKMDGVKIDIPQISQETEKRILALRIKKAESAIILCEESLDHIRSKIVSKQKDVINYGNIHAADLKAMKDQEGFAMKFLSDAQARLDSLTNLNKKPKLPFEILE